MTNDQSKQPAASSAWLTPAGEAAARGMVAIRRCLRCGRSHYPPREICPFCLGDDHDWDVSDSTSGVLLAETTLYHSNEERFRTRLPLRVGLVRLQCGPTVVAFISDGCVAGGRVKITASSDESGRPILTATAPGQTVSESHRKPAP